MHFTMKNHFHRSRKQRINVAYILQLPTRLWWIQHQLETWVEPTSPILIALKCHDAILSTLGLGEKSGWVIISLHWGFFSLKKIAGGGGKQSLVCGTAPMLPGVVHKTSRYTQVQCKSWSLKFWAVDCRPTFYSRPIASNQFRLKTIWTRVDG